MEFSLKPLSLQSVDRALRHAQDYRLRNEPEQAESICRDILRVAPDHAQALLLLVLSLTDQFKTPTRGPNKTRPGGARADRGFVRQDLLPWSHPGKSRPSEIEPHYPGCEVLRLCSFSRSNEMVRKG